MLALLAFPQAGCSRNDAAQPKGKVAAPVPVVTAPVVSKTVALTVPGLGTVEAVNSVGVKSRLDGQITAVRVADGADVRKGQILFEMDDRALRAQLRQAEANLVRDRALLANLQSKEKRYAELLASGFISTDAYHQIRTDLEAARATAEADAAAVEAARVQITYTRIEAPVDGRAGRVHIQAGNIVKANDASPMVTLVTLSPIYVAFAVPEQHLPAIRTYLAKGPLAVTASPAEGGAVTDGTLAFFDNAVDPQSGTIRLRASFPNRDRALWPGQYARVSMTLRQQADAVVAPAEAIQNGPKGQFVYVVKPDSSVEMRGVTVERTDGGDAVVAAGLKAGEVVVTDGQIRLTPGAKVKPRNG